MNRKFSFKRAAAAALTAALGLACLWPGLTARAADITIDDSAFRDPTKTSMTIYLWTAGLPPYSWSQSFGKEFPVLITWDDTYYLKITHSVAGNMEANIHAYTSALKDGWSDDNDDCGLMNGGFDDNDNDMPHGSYYINMMYSGSRLSDLDVIDFSLLGNNNYYYSLSIPDNIPNVIPVYPSNTGNTKLDSYGSLHKKAVRYSFSVDIDDWWFYDMDEVQTFDEDGGLRNGKNYLIAVRKDDCTHKVVDHTWPIPDDHYQYNGFRWTLYGLNDLTAQHTTNGDWFSEVSYSSGTYTEAVNNNQWNSYDWPTQFSWYAPERTDADGKKYNCFWTLGAWFHVKDFHICDEVGGWEDCETLTSSYPQVALAHKDGNFETCGNREGNTIYSHFTHTGIGYLDVNYALQKKYSFRCFYAKPETIDCLSTDYTVENGQVSNLDGPIAITNNATVTVKEGGTLSITGWVMNNGKIVVEEGGTLYVQDGACLCRYNEGTSYGGGIISNGLVIVGEEAKLIGGGADGLQLLNGSHVVNYGCVASENFKVVNDHTIENRDNGFVLHGAGNGVTNFGNVTYQTPLTHKYDPYGHVTGTFAERGQVLNTCSDNVDSVPNAIYWD